MRRQHRIREPQTAVAPRLFFYAPLTSDLLPVVGEGGPLSVKAQTNVSISDGAMYLSNGRGKILWNVPAQADVDCTFSVWVKKVANNGCSYSFGAPHPTNARYYGLMYQEHQSDLRAKLGTEYCNWFFMSSHASRLTNTSGFVFISWTIRYLNGSTYNCKIYKDGELVDDKTFTNTSWLGMQNCFFGISNGASTNSMTGYYKHFSVHEAMDDQQILELYERGGVPSL